jgi:hypothetical protein
LCEKVGDSLVPFYIGEGKGARVWSHELETADQVKLLEEELAIEGRSEEIEERKQDLSEKIRKIDEIKARGGEIVKYIVKWGMTSKEAFMVESALINLLRIGGLRFDSGDKDRLTNKILGHQSEGEKQTGTTKARTVEEFREEFAKEPLFFEDLKEEKVNALLININAGYPECLKFMKKEEREKAMRDTACGNWRMREIDALEKSGIEYVFATVQARIVGIYKIKEVNGKRFHYVYESAEVNSEYPHGEGVVPFRNGDYEFAQCIVTAAKSKGKHPSELVLDDMPSEYKKEFIEKIDKENLKAKEKKDPSLIFKNSLERKYMILEDISEDDPNYSRYMGYLHRRVIHTDAWVEEMKRKTDNIYGSGNPIKYIE